MDELMISGKRHAASIRIAKQYGYHSDYLGQLIRGGKVKGQKVGRAWYVDVESLASYLGKEAPPAPKAVAAVTEPLTMKEEAAVEAPEITVSEVAVAEIEPKLEPASVPTATEEIVEKEEPVLSVSTQEEAIGEKVQEKEIITQPVEERSHHIPVMVRVPGRESASTEAKKKASGLTYVAEDEPLLPQIRKNNRAPRKLDIEVETLAAAEDKTEVQEKNEVKVRAGYATQAFALATVGMLVLALVTAGSSLFVYKVSVGSAQTASVQFSMPE